MKNDYEDLKNLLIKASNSYYINSKPIMSDYDFDMKLKELEKMEKDQGYSDPDSPTKHPGSDLVLTDFSNQHKRPMLSLENTYDIGDVSKWYQDMIEATGEKNPEVVVELKYDGLSGAERFKAGSLYKGLTRGDGSIGEDVTDNLQILNGSNNHNNFTGEARGEVLITKAGFEELNKNNEYANARNLASGTLKLLDHELFKQRADKMKFYAYWLEDSKNTKFSEDLDDLKKAGFNVGPHYIVKSLKDMMDAIKKIDEDRETYDINIDGAVMKLNEKKYWTSIGSTSKFPRWAKAYKYKPDEAIATIKDITFEVGRTGKITPVAQFEPVQLSGSTISQATLNNKDYLEKFKLAIGDKVRIKKAAEIIPFIIDVESRNNQGNKYIKFPKTCPCCGSKLVKHNEEQVDYFCDNEDCSARIVDTISNYTHNMEIDGFAEIVIQKLHDAGYLNSITDIYTLKDHKDEIKNLDRFGELMVNRLLDNIEASKKNSLDKFIAALGIPNVGPKMAKTLAKVFQDMKVFEAATKEELMEVEDVGDIVADSIINYFKTHKKLVQFIIDQGQNYIETVNAQASLDLTGKKFCITGALSLPRDQYINLIESCGGKVVSGVTKETSYLITNDTTSGSRKNIAAQILGIPILSEKELLNMCNALDLLKEIS